MAKRNTEKTPSLGIALVTFGNEAELPELLLRLSKSKKQGDFIVLIDNHPSHGCAQIAEKSSVVDKVIRSENIGFSAGCNRAAEEMPDHIDLLFFLNPDALPEAESINSIRTKGKSGWGGWMGLITMPDGKINSSGNVVHMSGLSWCDDYGKDAEIVKGKTEVDILSGACMVVRKSAWDKVGGFTDVYFMYYEDTDISMKLHQAGYKLGIVPEARFVHEYIFNKSKLKWFHLERNRYIYIYLQWPLLIIILLLPFLLACEIGLWVISILQGRFRIKGAAMLSLIKLMPSIRAEKRIQKNQLRTLSSRELINFIHPEINTPLLGALANGKYLNAIFKFYFSLIKLPLKLIRS